MTAFVETRDHGQLREIRMARPPVNALNPELCRGLIAALDTAIGDGVHGIVLTGNPKVFSAGMDVPYLLSLGEDREGLLDGWQAFFGVARTLAESRVPVVAALSGHAPAGGCVLALCCDYRIMARSPDPARPFAIGLNETQVGLVVPEGIQQLLRRAVGVHRAGNLMVSGEMVPADRALAIGLVDELAEPEQLLRRALAWLEKLAGLPQQPMLQTRSLARAELVAALHGDNIQLERFLEGWHSADAQQALRALVARLGK